MEISEFLLAFLSQESDTARTSGLAECAKAVSKTNLRRSLLMLTCMKPETHEGFFDHRSQQMRVPGDMQGLGLPPMYSHPTLPLSVHYALNLCYHAQKPAPFTLCYERARQLVRIAYSPTLILLLLRSSGDVEVNPCPAVPSSTPTPQVLSFVNFCNRKSLGFHAC